jgi:hypothetical protein
MIDNKDQQKEAIVELVEKLSPYMPPILQNTEYMWFDGETLYMLTDSIDETYHDRLSGILKEEFDFVKEIKFVSRRI